MAFLWSRAAVNSRSICRANASASMCASRVRHLDDIEPVQSRARERSYTFIFTRSTLCVETIWDCSSLPPQGGTHEYS
jgi:hypothetical protein